MSWLASDWHLDTWRRSSCYLAPQSLNHGLEWVWDVELNPFFFFCLEEVTVLALPHSDLKRRPFLVLDSSECSQPQPLLWSELRLFLPASPTAPCFIWKSSIQRPVGGCRGGVTALIMSIPARSYGTSWKQKHLATESILRTLKAS